ncbi:aminopeptidase N-like [Chironomus tepperi]|uniref:aminopeptidase N-like n=1 Tax=Chironomus tepperi TaxID=113505 RepID=UPI00391FC37A
MWLLKFAVLSVYLTILLANPLDEPEQNEGNNLIKADEAISYRLPNNTIPIRYEIKIKTDIHQNMSEFSGTVKIHVKLLENSTSITLHSRQLYIQRISIYQPGLPFPLIPDAIYEEHESNEFLVINLPKVYEAGTEFEIVISYLGELRVDSTGFYRGDYLNAAGHSRSYATTHFKLNHSRSAFPCYDEPGFRAVMQLTLVHGKTYSALSNTEVLLQLEDGDYYSTLFVATPAMPTYLLAFFVSDYDHIDAVGTSRIPNKIHATPNAINDGFGNFAASVVVDVFKKYEEILDVDYPLSKIDNVALSVTLYKRPYLFGAHGMENFGLIMYSSYGFLVDPSFTGNYRKNYEHSITSLISHVYANQWFGNIVTPKWWQYSWLSAGIAKFFELYLPSLLYPNGKYMDKFFVSTMPIAFIHDKIDAWSMNHYVDHPDDIKYKFDGITYNKAACVLRMFMECVGEDVFLDGLNNYLNSSYMQSATPEDLHAAIDKAFLAKNPGVSLNVGQLMSTWENNAGYPLVSVKVSGNSLVFSQRRYPEGKGELYMIPITLATKTLPDFMTRKPKAWMDAQTMTLSQSSLKFTENDWIILNIDQVGYYRVDYDLPLWHAIIDQLKEDHNLINPINRAVLMTEIYIAWTQLDRVTVAEVLDILSYLGKEKDVNVWRNAQNLIRGLDSKLLGTDMYDNYLEFLKTITTPHLTELSYHAFPGEDYEKTRRRGYTKTWNCQALDDNCLSKDLEKFTSYRSGTSEADFVFCNALKVVNEAEFTKLLQDVISDISMDYRDDFVNYMGCTRSSNNLKKLQQAALNSTNGLESYDREMFLYNMARYSNLGLEESVNFMDENYKELANVIEKFHDPLYYIAANVKDAELVTKFKNTLKKMVDEGIVLADDAEFFLDVIKSNQDWMDDNYNHVVDYFTVPETTTPDSGMTVIVSLSLICISLLIHLIN